MRTRIVAASLLMLFLGVSVIAYEDNSFGAIAYSKRFRRWGYATQKHNRAAAEARALELCDRNDCTIEVWFRDNCAALATGSDGQIVGWAYNESSRRAKERAVDECRERDGDRCKVVVSICSH